MLPFFLPFAPAPAPPGRPPAPFRAQAAAISLPWNVSPPKCARLSPLGHAQAPFCAQAAAISLPGNVSPPKCACLPPPGCAPACSSTLRHLQAPSNTFRPQMAPFLWTGGSYSPPRKHFPIRMCPPVPTRALSGTFSADRRLVFFVREIRRDHLPLPDCILQRGTAPSKTILFGKEHHTLPNRSPVGVAVPSEFHKQPTRNNTYYYKFHT